MPAHAVIVIHASCCATPSRSGTTVYFYLKYHAHKLVIISGSRSLKIRVGSRFSFPMVDVYSTYSWSPRHTLYVYIDLRAHLSYGGKSVLNLPDRERCTSGCNAMPAHAAHRADRTTSIVCKCIVCFIHSHSFSVHIPT